jgi:hypothetical protein
VQETPTNTSRRLARKRGTTLKKTDEEHPFFKRMKVDLTTEHEMKENSMNFSNGHCWSGNKLVSKLPTTGFKAKVTEFNQLEERSLKLRRCNTELL